MKKNKKNKKTKPERELTLLEKLASVSNKEKIVAIVLYFLVYLFTILAVFFLIKGTEELALGIKNGIYSYELFSTYGISALDFKVFLKYTILPLLYILLALSFGLVVLVPSHYMEDKFGKTGRKITVIIVVFSISLFQDKLGPMPAVALAILGIL